MRGDWVVALVLAVGVSVALVAGVLTAELTPTKVTSEEIAFLSTLGGASVGAVAAYLGTRHASPQKERRMTTEDPTTPDPEPIPDPEPEPTEPEPTEPEPDEDEDSAATDTPTLEDGEAEDVGPDTA